MISTWRVSSSWRRLIYDPAAQHLSVLAFSRCTCLLGDGMGAWQFRPEVDRFVYDIFFTVFVNKFTFDAAKYVHI